MAPPQNGILMSIHGKDKGPCPSACCVKAHLWQGKQVSQGQGHVMGECIAGQLQEDWKKEGQGDHPACAAGDVLRRRLGAQLPCLHPAHTVATPNSHPHHVSFVLASVHSGGPPWPLHQR